MSQSTQTPEWGPPPTPQPPKPKRRSRGAGWIVGIGVTILIIWIIGTLSGGNTASSPTVTTNALTATPSTGAPVLGTVATNTFPATTAAPKPKPKTLLAISGTGSHTHATPRFTVPKNYGFKVYWSYKATGLFAGDPVNFILTVEDPDAAFSAPDVNELDTHGTGVEEYNGEGTYWISIISESTWTLKIIAIPNGCLTDSPPSCP